jgi:hypothetical protein
MRNKGFVWCIRIPLSLYVTITYKNIPCQQLAPSVIRLFGQKSKEKPIDPTPANTLRFAGKFVFLPMTSLYRDALPVPNQSARSPFAYLFRSRASS